jgi:hypothetical protein
VLEPDGRLRIVDYEVDGPKGFHAVVRTQFPGRSFVSKKWASTTANKENLCRYFSPLIILYRLQTLGNIDFRFDSTVILTLKFRNNIKETGRIDHLPLLH